MSKPISIRWVPKDALDGMQVLSAMEELAYRRLIDLVYTTDDNVPDDDKYLAWFTKTGRQWKAIKEKLILVSKLRVSDHKIVIRKCQLVLQERTGYIKQQSEKGKVSSEKRKSLNDNKTDSTVVATIVPTKSQPDCEPDGNQESNPIPNQPPNPDSSSLKPYLSKDRSSLESRIEGASQRDDDLEKIFRIGSKIFPALEKRKPEADKIIGEWLESGYGADLEIIPELQRLEGNNIGSWKYFSDGLKQSRNRTKTNGNDNKIVVEERIELTPEQLAERRAFKEKVGIFACPS